MSGLDESAGAPARTRRTSTEVRNLVLRAARQLFAAEGFERAGTREIAEAAGVTQAAIFRHFETKEGLYEEAVAEPFESCISSFLDDWGDQEIAPSSNTEIAHSFMSRFYELLRSNRELFVAYMMRPESSLNGGAVGAESALSRQLTAIVERMESEASGRGVLRADIPIAVRCAAALAISFALHDKVLFPVGSERPDDRRIFDEMVAYSLAGIER